MLVDWWGRRGSGLSSSSPAESNIKRAFSFFVWNEKEPSAQSSILSNFLNNGIYLKRYQITKHERNERSMQNAFALLETCWNKRVSLPTNRNGQGGFLVLINMQTAKFMRFSRIFVPTREYTILNFSRRSLPLDLKHRELAGEHHKKPKWNPGILMC